MKVGDRYRFKTSQDTFEVTIIALSSGYVSYKLGNYKYTSYTYKFEEDYEFVRKAYKLELLFLGL